MYSLLRLITCSFLMMLLVSCSTTSKLSKVDDLASQSRYKFPAWQFDDSNEFQAINSLLLEIDGLIENNALDAAEDKLERVLRIKTEYAPAWSRLSWMALEMNSPQRAVQMAKRSNSFAYGNRKLQSLNWSFIKDANKMLDNLDEYLRAAQKIESLRTF